MRIEPIPNSLLGDEIVVQKPDGNGWTDYAVKNVRAERFAKTEGEKPEANRAAVELKVWADCENSVFSTDFAVGMRIKYGGEVFEITEVKALRGESLHHFKISAVKIGDDE